MIWVTQLSTMGGRPMNFYLSTALTGPIHYKSNLFFVCHEPSFTLLKQCRCELDACPEGCCTQSFVHFIHMVQGVLVLSCHFFLSVSSNSCAFGKMVDFHRYKRYYFSLCLVILTIDFVWYLLQVLSHVRISATSFLSTYCWCWYDTLNLARTSLKWSKPTCCGTREHLKVWAIGLQILNPCILCGTATWSWATTWNICWQISLQQ